jgi:hypothetical protein
MAVAIPIPVVIPAIVIPSVAVVVPTMVMIEPAMIAVPVASVKTLSIVSRPDPTRALIRRASPVPVVPPITASVGVPVAIYPDEFRPRTRRKNPNHPRSRRRADSDSDGNLAKDRRSTHERQQQQSSIH